MTDQGADGAPRDEWSEAVDVLTRLARLRMQVHDHADPSGQTVHAGGPIDLAGALAGVLAAVSANLGGTAELTAGRPGSWEAGLVHQLVAGTVGQDDAYLWEHRTEPVVVPLNVLDLPYDNDAFPSLDLALGRLDDRYDTLPDADHDAAAYSADLEAITATYAELYQTYAAAFTTQVLRAAAAVPGLRVPVRVDAVHDPRAAGQPRAEVRNPFDAGAADALAVILWRAAYAAVPTPVAPPVPGHPPDGGLAPATEAS